MENNIIDTSWCENHNFKLQILNVANHLTYFYESDGKVIITYTRETVGKYVLSVYNYDSDSLITLERKRLNKITTDDLKKCCHLLGINYPF